MINQFVIDSNDFTTGIPFEWNFIDFFDGTECLKFSIFQPNRPLSGGNLADGDGYAASCHKERLIE
jgi:hypothetical protein